MELKHNRQSHEAKKNQSNHNTNNFLGKSCCSKPHYLLLYIQHGYMNKLDTTLLTRALLYSANFLTLLDKTDQYLANFLPPINLPCLQNSCGMQSLFHGNFGLSQLHWDHGQSNGWVQPNNPTTDSQLPFHLDLN